MKSYIYFFLLAFQAISLRATESTTWNFLLYAAANNNLHPYAQQSINEIKAVGSNKNITVFAQLDSFGRQAVTRYRIERGRSVPLISVIQPPESQSGTAENLFDFVKDSLSRNKADKLALILWNHGTGVKDLYAWIRTVPYCECDELFIFNHESQLYELNREPPIFRGIAYNDFAQTYLSNTDLKICSSRISTELLGGRKIDILGLDACTMAMVEICTQVKDSVEIVIGSQEIAIAPGWDYTGILKPFEQKKPSPIDLTKQIINTYGARYHRRFADLTQSAINLQNFSQVEKTADEISTLLIKLISKRREGGIATALKKIRQSGTQTKQFQDTDYIDLIHFYKSLQRHVKMFTAKTEQNKSEMPTLQKLEKALETGIKTTSSCIIANSAGQRAKNAHGLSIYFPKGHIHASYSKNDFSQTTNWLRFLNLFLQLG